MQLVSTPATALAQTNITLSGQSGDERKFEIHKGMIIVGYMERRDETLFGTGFVQGPSLIVRATHNHPACAASIVCVLTPAV
jgi:hypothetical protein